MTDQPISQPDPRRHPEPGSDTTAGAHDGTRAREQAAGCLSSATRPSPRLSALVTAARATQILGPIPPPQRTGAWVHAAPERVITALVAIGSSNPTDPPLPAPLRVPTGDDHRADAMVVHQAVATLIGTYLMQLRGGCECGLDHDLGRDDADRIADRLLCLAYDELGCPCPIADLFVDVEHPAHQAAAAVCADRKELLHLHAARAVQQIARHLMAIAREASPWDLLTVSRI